MINLIWISFLCWSQAQIQIPQYTSGTIQSPSSVTGATLASPITNSITITFSITFTSTPQIYLATNMIHQYRGQLCLAATVTAKSTTQFTVQLKFCESQPIYKYGLSYLAINDPYVYIYNQIISPTSSSTSQTITFGAFSWVQAPTYCINIIGIQFQSAQTTFYNLITISAISITSATILVTENNSAGSYYPIQFNIIFTTPEFLSPITQAFNWNTGYMTIVSSDGTNQYCFAKPKISSPSTYVNIEGFSGIGYSNQQYLRLYYNSVYGYINEGKNILKQDVTYYSDLKLTYSAFHYEPFICNGITTGNQCTCTNGFYLTFSGCLQCSASCATCATSPTNCLSCKSNALLKSSVCLCNNGYYMDAALSCSKCDSSCLTCISKSTYCTSCPTGKVALSGQCQTCPIQTQNINGACTACQSNCDSCYLAYCTQCSATYLYQITACNPTTSLQLGTCVSQCQAGYFQNNANSCCKCSLLCATCSAYSVCLSCITNYVLQGSICQPTCNNQYFSLNGICTSCYSTCLTCTAASNNSCLQCNSPLYYYQGQCVSTCPDLTSLISGICVQCYQGCQTCFGTSQNQCSTCLVNYFFLSNSCQQFCPYKYYQNTTIYQCSPCPNNCNVCTNSTQCVGCLAGYYLYNNICYAQCPPLTYNSQKTCQLCDTSCQTCQNGFLSGCTACSGSLLLSQGYCIDACQNGYYQSGSTCIQCDVSCQQCTSNSTNCSACSTSKYLVNNQCLLNCPSGFYGDISQGLCFKCHSSCLTCYGATQFNCLSCTNTLYDNTCIQTCPSGTTLYNGQCFDQSPKVLVCAQQCNGCFLSQYSCINCAGNRQNNQPLCGCQQGYFDVGQANCQKCDHKCQSCINSSATCIVCLGTRRTNECTCPSGTYDDLISTNCTECLISCQTCSQSSNNCLTCRNNRILNQSTCNCLSGYFEANTSFCQLCSYQCTTCTTSSTNCLTCSDIRIQPPTCSCPNGYYDNGYVACPKCPQECLTCSDSACLTCPNNRIGPSSFGSCDCPVGAMSLLPFSSYCQDCSVAVPIIFFDSLLKSVIIEFRVQINTQIQICSQVFVQTTIYKFGQNPQCLISNTQLKINLGYGATIVVGDIIALLPNTIKGSLSSSPCQTFYTLFAPAPITLPSVALTSLVPSVTFEAPSQLSTCSPIKIAIQQQYYDGMRPFKISQIQQVLPTNDQNQALTNFLSQKNHESNLQSPITIPQYTLSHRTNYKFTMVVTSFIGLSNTQQIQFTTGQTEIVDIQFLTTQAVFYRYMQNNISVQISYTNCSQDPLLFTTLAAQWLVNGSLFSQSELSGLDSGFNTLLTLSIPPFNLSFGQATLNLQVVLDANLILATQTFIFNVIRSPLALSITGANQQYGLTQNINLAAKVINHDYQIGDPIQEYTYSWNCQDIALQASCQDMQGNFILFTSSVNQTIPPKTLTPYRAYLIILQIQYGSTTASTSGSLSVTELDLPVLSFNKTSVVNLFDESIIQLVYPNTNADSLSYSAAIVYNLDVQSTFAFYYLSLKYKQWHYFSNLSTIYSGNITLRTTVYDPRYYMPSIAQINFIYNIPPQGCQVRINTNNVTEFQTTLIISVSECTSTNLPLSYRYSMYTSNSTYNSDIQTSQDLNRILLSDYTVNYTKMATYLFLNQTNDSQSQVQILMISIKDSLNGITNITTPVTVNLNSQINEALFTNYINSQKSLSNIIYAYQQVGNRLMTLGGFTTYKSQVYNILLQYLSAQLTPSLTCVVQQVASQLSQLDGITSILSLQQANTVNNQISNMISSCISTLSSLYKQQLNGALDSSSFIVYYQNYQSLNYLISLLSSQINYFTVKNLSTVALTQLLESTITQTQNLSIPNQPPAQTYSKYLNMYTSLSSEKMINSLAGNLLQKQTTLGQNSNRLLQITSQAQIYKYSNKIYNNNPFYLDDSFPKNSSNYSCVDITLINQQTQTAQAIIQNASIAIPIKQPTNNTLSCISKLSGSWQANICKTTKVNSTVSCNCQQLSPVSLMLAFNQIEEQTAKSFTSDAINALASFHFWETIVFYVYIVGTFCYIAVIYKGYQLDKLVRDQNLQIQKEIQDKQMPDQQIMHNKLRRFKDMKIIQSDEIALKKQQDTENIEMPNKVNQVQLGESESTIAKQEEQISKIQAYIMFVKQFHILFSIFYKFDQKLSRPVRCTIYYISTLGMLSTIFMFGQSANISLNIAIGLILAPMTKIFTLVFEKLISNEKVYLKYIGVFLMTSVCGFWSYMLLTQIALLGDVYEVNYLTINFMITWIFDNCLYGPIQLIFQFVVQTYIVNLPFIRQLMKQLLDEESRQFIDNLSQQLYDA